MRIEHIALYVNDLEAARNFFMKYLGATSNDGYYNPKTNFRSYFLSFDNGARLEIMNKPEMSDLPKDCARTGYTHIAFSVGSKEKVDDLTAALAETGSLNLLKAGIRENIAARLARAAASSGQSGRLSGDEARLLVDTLFSCAEPETSPSGHRCMLVLTEDDIERQL